MHYPNASYDHERLENVLAIGEAGRWTWLVPLGEVWRLLWVLCDNNDTIAHTFRASIIDATGQAIIDQVAVGIGGLEALLLEVSPTVAGYSRRGGEIWIPPGFSFRVQKAVVNTSASTDAVTLAWARYDSVRGRAVTEGVAVQL